MNLRAIHQIEITSECNLRCRYCTHPYMPRAKQHMDRATYWRALTHARKLWERFKSPELNLCGIGESTMHPEFVEYVHIARSLMGWGVDLILATNGVALTEDHAKALRQYKVRTWVSLHRPEKAGPAIELLKEYGVLSGVSADPSIASVDWAGQVKWHVSAAKGSPCDWLHRGWGFVMSDGRVGTCCFDAQGADGIIGHVNDEDLSTAEVRPYSLCCSCHLSVPQEEKQYAHV